jgi:uncharacterized membrane protein
MPASKKRFWEIDALRGIAVILMIFFHLLFDLRFFAGLSFGLGQTFWFWFPRATASIFILLVGVSLSISSSRAGTNPKRFLNRGLRIFIYGLLISIFTLLLFPQEFIVFGILHLIGFSIIITIPFQKWKIRNFVLGIATILLGLFLETVPTQSFLYLWLGLFPKTFQSFDFFPLFPWIGLVFLGLAAGNLIYPKAKRLFPLQDLAQNPIVRPLAFLGRHSLPIYFLHQPVLVLIILLLA